MSRHFPNRASQPGYLLGSQAAAILHVSSKTVSRWAAEGKLRCQRTLGGHRRYLEADIRELAKSLTVSATDTSPYGRPRSGVSRPRG